MNTKIIIAGISAIAIIILGYFLFSKDASNNAPVTDVKENTVLENTDNRGAQTDFSKMNAEFLFSANIPPGFAAEYIPALKAINIYDPSLPGENNMEKSQIYITYFKANNFLTLNTVDILRRYEVTVKGRAAVAYEIAKKPNVANFAGQPGWRNAKHNALDIRYSNENPSHFYPFAYNPALTVPSSNASPEKIFSEFIDSLIFKEDQ